MNFMFKNCKSLSNFPNLSKWMIGRDTNIDDMFEDCFLLKVSIVKKEFNNNFMMRCLKNIIICFTNLGEKLPGYNFYYSALFWFFMIITIFISFCFPIFLFYWPFHLDKAYKCINNPIAYFNLNKIKMIL